MGIDKVWLYILPKRILTAVVGFLARRPVSRFFIPLYVRFYGINTSEAEKEIQAYPTLVAFFSRRLHPDARLAQSRDFSAPVDGTVQGFGAIEKGLLLQAKGSYYTVSALLGDSDDAARFEGGCYITLYLSPRDYHRIHMPLPGNLTTWRYIPGKLFPVNKLGVKNIHGLFTKNERLVTFVESDAGEFAIVKIGATVVGSIKTSYGPTHTGVFSKSRRSRLEGSVRLHKDIGDEVGYFEFGSTVILLFSSSFSIDWDIEQGEFVQMGQQLGRLKK